MHFLSKIVATVVTIIASAFGSPPAEVVMHPVMDIVPVIVEQEPLGKIKIKDVEYTDEEYKEKKDRLIKEMRKEKKDFRQVGEFFEVVEIERINCQLYRFENVKNFNADELLKLLAIKLEECDENK